jgi:DNA-binding winged helix-turn-helix (wHTH) protein
MNAAMGALRFKGFTLEVAAGALRRGDQQVALRPQPFKVLTYLAQHSGRLVGNNELVEKCWDNPKQTKANSLAQCIKAIREALGETDQEIIRTVHGRGYVFAPPVSVLPAGRPQERAQQHDPDHDHIGMPFLPEPGGASATPQGPAPLPATSPTYEPHIQTGAACCRLGPMRWPPPSPQSWCCWPARGRSGAGPPARLGSP